LNFTVTNYQSVTLSVSKVTIGGAQASDFAQINNCLPSLAPNASCGVSVTFTPAGTGYRHAGLLIYDNASGSPQTQALNGIGQ
jgi:hypothetical protein